MKKSSEYLDSAGAFLMRPVDASTLGAFRFIFGILMVGSTLKYFYKGLIKSYYIDSKFLFTYDLFPWVTPWPGDGMYYLFAVIGVSALLLALGLFCRLSAAAFFLSYTYVFLLEKGAYNNHYYFICLIAFLFCIVNSGRWMSLDALWKRKFDPDSQAVTVPYWNVLIIKTQVFIVYFYGGIAKLNLDWLNGEPMRHWLEIPAGREGTPAFAARFLESEFGVYFFSYGGVIFELSIGFLLICRKTRLLAFGLIFIFNLTNQWMFKIGIFPLLMIATAVIFLEPDTPRNFIKKCLPRLKQDRLDLKPRPSRFRKSAISFVSIYLMIQILLPFRHWLYEGHVSWTEEGQDFAWRMKLRDKGECRLGFFATNRETGETSLIPLGRFLAVRQFIRMCQRPHMIIQFAHFLGKKLEEEGISNPIITARTLVSLNYRPPQSLIDPDVNLTEEEYSVFKHSKWILPLKE